MGVLNVTPDSFSDGGHASSIPAQAVDAARRDAGRRRRPHRHRRRVDTPRRGAGRSADGGAPAHRAGHRSACAGAADSPDLDRHLQGGRRRARRSMRGASIVNDISGLRYDPELADVVARRGAAIILMHTAAARVTCTRDARYGDVVAEVRDELERASRRGDGRRHREASASSSIPGLGFAKRRRTVSRRSRASTSSASSDRPLLVGPVAEVIPDARPRRTVPGHGRATGPRRRRSPPRCSLGAHIVRVHAVSEMVDVVARRRRDSAVSSTVDLIDP